MMIMIMEQVRLVSSSVQHLLSDFPLVLIQIIHEDDNEPDNVGSNEEDYVLDNGGPPDDQVFSFGDAFVNTNNRDGGGVFVHRCWEGGK
jgi:hypothetical protein